ncbi:hypothetical protein ACSBR1_014811 [Camellia fascicularis]
MFAELKHKINLYALMAESQKRASSPVNSKEKTSLLDMDFGKDFLSSWKSMPMAEDDAMDFDFGTTAKGKKKAFNFNNLDVDFNFDGDLDKISSFKVDISDLDISSPTKIAGKSKERSKEPAGGSHQQEQNRFSFPFDFNELDSFSFESSLTKEGKKSIKNQKCKDMSNRIECQGSETDLTDAIGASEDGLTPKLPASVGLITSKIDIPVDGLGLVDSRKKNCTSNSLRNDNGPSKSATLQNEVASEETRTLPEKTPTATVQEKSQECYQQEKTTFPEPCAEETMQDLSVQSVSENESTEHNASELHVEVCSLATKVSSNTGGEENVICKSIANPGFHCENQLLDNSPAIYPAQHITSSLSNNGEMNKFENDNNVSVGYVDGTEPAQGDSDSGDSSTISVSMEAMHGTKANTDNQNANGKLHLASLSSGTTVGKLIQMKEKETGVTQSKFFKRSDETKSQSQQAASTQKKLAMFGGKSTGHRQNCAAEEGRECVDAKDAQSGNKLVGISTSHSGELNKGKPIQPRSTSSVKGLKGVGERFNANGALNGSKLFGSSRLHEREVIKGESVQGSGKNIKNLTISSCFYPSSSSEHTNKSTTRNCTNPSLPALSMVSVKKSNDVCGEANKVSPPKAGRSILDLSSLRISRTIGANKYPSQPSIQKEIKSLRNPEQSMELQGSTASKMAHSVCTEKQTLSTPCLKRKKFEGLNADMLTLNPSKRLSPSPTESRSVGGSSEKVVVKEVCSHENCKTSTPDVPQEVNMTELEIPFVMENDVNVEKAEAYTKELEDICNMLRKKHEEAKEILVRGLVNNNNLLMLNHPIYEEKIRKVQKFAAQLMSTQT